MSRFRFGIAVVVVWSLAVQSLLPASLLAGDLLPGFLTRQKPPTARDFSAETLAKEIDYLEFHIDTYGTVVPKQPDVWGQARLTKHRQEYEAVTYGYLTHFQQSLQGGLNRSDQSFLGLALALNASVTPAAAAPVAAAAPTPPGVAIVSQLFPNGLGGGRRFLNSAGGAVRRPAVRHRT